MKNNLKNALICTFLAGGAIFTSCNKDQTTVKETYVIADNYKNLDQQIAQFRSSMLDTRKSGTAMELNEAVWMMEASFNYYHGFTDEDYLVTKTDSTFIPINYGGFEEVPIEELQQLFKQVNNAIVTSFENYAGINKKPYVFDLELQGTTTGTQLLIMTTVGSINTQKSTKSANTINPFGATDYWYPGYLSGKCDIYVGDHWNESSADIQLKSASLKYIKLRFGSGFYFADITTILVDITPNNYPGMIFEGSRYDCIAPSSMNTYYHGLEYIIEDIKPIGKTYVNISVETILISMNGSNVYHQWHHPQYGVKTARELPPIEPTGF